MGGWVGYVVGSLLTSIGKCMDVLHHLYEVLGKVQGTHTRTQIEKQKTTCTQFIVNWMGTSDTVEKFTLYI